MSDQLQMTDGMHIIVEALKQNNIDTIYGVVGIPVTDMARHAGRKAFVILVFVMSSRQVMPLQQAVFFTQKPWICLTVSAPDSSTV